jgi:hypothetical protein
MLPNNAQIKVIFKWTICYSTFWYSSLYLSQTGATCKYQTQWYSQYKWMWIMISLSVFIFCKINSPQNISSRLANIFLLQNFFHHFPATQHWTSCLHVKSYTWPLPAITTSTQHSYSCRKQYFPVGASRISLLEPPKHQYMFGDLYGPPLFPLVGPLLLWIRPRPRWNMPPRVPRFCSWPLCGVPRVLIGRPQDCWLAGDGPSHTMGWILGFSATERK